MIPESFAKTVTKLVGRLKIDYAHSDGYYASYNLFPFENPDGYDWAIEAWIQRVAPELLHRG